MTVRTIVEHQLLSAILLDLARRAEARAIEEASRVPYWEPCPVSVMARRQAAADLREEAQRLLGGAA